MGLPVWPILKKILSIFLTIIVILSVNFCIFYVIPGDPARTFVPRGIDPFAIELLRERLHLDDPIYMQYAYYLMDSLTGDLRITSSYLPGTEISKLIGHYIGFTLALFVSIVVASISVGVVLERLVVRGKSKITGRALYLLSLLLLSIPVFYLGLEILLMNARHDIGLPLRGNGTEHAETGLGMVRNILEHLLLPVLTGVLSTVGMFVLLARASLSELRYARRESKEEPSQISQGKSIADGLFMTRPFPQFFLTWTMSCALLIDLLFSYGGLGELCWDAAYYRDLTLMMACFFAVSMIVLVGNIVFSIVLSWVRGEKLHGAVAGWVHNERISIESQGVAGPRVSYKRALSEFAKSMWKGYRKGTVGMLALVVFSVLFAVGVLAPFLSTVDDPTKISNFDSSNLPPSLKRSPSTGWLHPLGTDHYGRDVYSMWLYAARNAVIDVLGVVLGATLIGVLVGIVASKTIRMDEWLASFLDFLLTVPARAFLAIPFFVLAMTVPLMVHFRYPRWMDLFLIFLLLGMYSWAWVVVMRRVRLQARIGPRPKSQANVTVASRTVLPTILGSALLVTKFAVLALIVWETSLGFINMFGPRDATWYGMLEHAYTYGGFEGRWYLVLPPIFGIFLVTASAFVILDRLEMIAKNEEVGLDAGVVTTAAPKPDIVPQ